MQKNKNDVLEDIRSYNFNDDGVATKVEDGVLYRFKKNENGNFKVASTFKYKNIRELIPEEHMNSVESSHNKSGKAAKKEFKFEFSVDRNGNKFISGYKFKNKNETKNYIFDENGNAIEIFTEKTQFHKDSKIRKSYNKVEQKADGSSVNINQEWNKKSHKTLDNRYGMDCDCNKWHENERTKYHEDGKTRKSFAREGQKTDGASFITYEEFNKKGNKTLDNRSGVDCDGKIWHENERTKYHEDSKTEKSYNKVAQKPDGSRSNMYLEWNEQGIETLHNSFKVYCDGDEERYHESREYYEGGVTEKSRNIRIKNRSGFTRIKNYDTRNGKYGLVAEFTKDALGNIKKNGFLSKICKTKKGAAFEVVQNFVENNKYVMDYKVKNKNLLRKATTSLAIRANKKRFDRDKVQQQIFHP